MFIPNTFGYLSRSLGPDKFAQDSYGPRRSVACAVVHLKDVKQKTSVRTDTSASRSHAEETVMTGKVLFPTSVAIAKGDKFEILGRTLRVIQIEPRNDVLGRHDHNEVDFEVWTR
jgi:hypothetical protein